MRAQNPTIGVCPLPFAGFEDDRAGAVTKQNASRAIRPIENT